MISKTVTYTDYNDVERTETHWFHLTESELMELEMGTTGGLAEMIKKIVEAQDAPAIIDIFKKIVLMAYGQKSADGRRFMKKTPEGYKLSDEFAETEAYSMIFMELATDADAAAKFVNGIMPAKVAEKAKANAIPPAKKSNK